MISAQNDVVIDLHCTTITRDSKYRDPYDIESWKIGAIEKERIRGRNSIFIFCTILAIL